MKTETIVEMFLRTAEQYPENKAVSDETGSITYRELNALSDLAADRILKMLPGISKAESKDEGEARTSAAAYWNVGVLFPRKKEALAAFLGVLKSGCSYVYASPDVPSDRFDFIMQDAEAVCIVTTREAAAAFAGSAEYPLICMEDILADFHVMHAANAADSMTGSIKAEHINRSDFSKPAFLTYTSGSTGKPKGVVDTYYYINNHIEARHSFYKPGPDECIGNIVSFSYAASTYDLFSGLTVGCNLYIFSDEELLNQSVTVKRVIDNNITTMFMIPNMISVVFAPGAKLPIRCVITAGEKAKQIPEISAQIAEIYGSSEAAAVIGRVARPGDPWNLLGKAMPGNTLFLLDEDGNRITQPGTPGELCIVNDALALEYRNRPEDTAAKFVDCPFLAGARMYKSGDLMQFDENGTFYYCGRKDNMTKINGQRVEMGEIESNIVAIDGVKDAVCAVIQRNNAGMLVCYYIPDREKKAVTAAELTAYAAARLPRYMVPLYWIALDAFPRNVNGKVDRKAMPVPDFGALTLNAAPENDVEEALLSAAAKLLPDIRFGVTDDLLKLGMDSILAVQFVTEAEKYAPGITVSDVLRIRNIRDLVSAQKQVSWFYEEYDASKDVIVLIHGIIPVSGLGMVCEKWSRYFNILEIEPYLDHIRDVCEEYDYDRLIAFYLEEVGRKLPEGCRLWGFAGFSFGGQLALSLAAEWEKKTHTRTHVFLGDSLIQLMYPGKKLPVLTEKDPYIQMVQKNSQRYGNSSVREPLDQIIKKQNAVLDLMRTIKANTKYEGPVLYLDARLDYDDTTQAVKIGTVKSLCRNITILEFHKNFHNDLYMTGEVVAQYDEILSRWLAGAYDKVPFEPGTIK